MRRIWISILLLAVSATMAAAADKSKLKLLSVELTAGTADIGTEFSSSFTGYAQAFPQSELGWKLQYWNMMGPEYAFAISGGQGFYNEEDKPGSNSLPGDPTLKYSQNSWNIRIGGDRILAVGDKTYVFFGPGIEYWTGKAKFEGFNTPTPTYETENTTRISLDARLGGHMMVGPTWGITAQVGTKIGHATYKETGAETTWWPSSMQGSLGLVFKFGS
jgi:hypothetical protein